MLELADRVNRQGRGDKQALKKGRASFNNQQLTPDAPFGSNESAQAFVLHRIRYVDKSSEMDCLHEGIIDSDHENFPRVLQLLRVDIARNVGVGAGRAL